MLIRVFTLGIKSGYTASIMSVLCLWWNFSLSKMVSEAVAAHLEGNLQETVKPVNFKNKYSANFRSLSSFNRSFY